MRNAPWAALLLALAGCGEAETPSREAPAAAPDGGQKARIEALAPGQRDAVFLRAIRDAGHDCQQVVGSAYNGEQFEMPSWAARCSDGRDWLIMLAQDGRALVAQRKEAPAKAP